MLSKNDIFLPPVVQPHQITIIDTTEPWSGQRYSNYLCQVKFHSTEKAGFSGYNGKKQAEKGKVQGGIFTTQHGWHAWRSEVVGRLLETLGLGSVIP